MKVYRVEHLKETQGPVFMGPYENEITSCEAWASPMSNFHGDDSHPEPFADPLLMNWTFPIDWRDHYYCGFTSLSQLKSWFTSSELKNLKDLGFVIASYEAKEVQKGKTQCLFIPKGKRKIVSK